MDLLLMHEQNKHRTKMLLVKNELLLKYTEKQEHASMCSNCDSCCTSDEYSTYIYWHKYNFCSEWCRMDRESDIRKSYIEIKIQQGNKTIQQGNKTIQQGNKTIVPKNRHI